MPRAPAPRLRPGPRGRSVAGSFSFRPPCAIGGRCCGQLSTTERIRCGGKFGSRARASASATAARCTATRSTSGSGSEPTTVEPAAASPPDGGRPCSGAAARRGPRRRRRRRGPWRPDAAPRAAAGRGARSVCRMGARYPTDLDGLRGESRTRLYAPTRGSAPGRDRGLQPRSGSQRQLQTALRPGRGARRRGHARGRRLRLDHRLCRRPAQATEVAASISARD